MSRPRWQFPFRDHTVLITGALAATLLGALAALQLDLVVAAGERLLHPVGQEVLLKTTATAGLTGLLCWVICALVARAISRHALKPYDALADHFERLADGEVEDPVNLRGSVPGVRRLARAVVVFHQMAQASQRSEADLQLRYDRLHQEQADERRLLMGMLMDRRLSPERASSAPGSFDGSTSAEFEIPEPPPAAPGAADGTRPQTGQVVDLAGRLKSSARRVESDPAGESEGLGPMPLDFVIRR